MILGKFFGAIAAQFNKLGNWLFNKDPIAQMQYEYDKAVEQFQKTLELEPKFPLVHILLGNLALRKRDLATARQEFQHFLDLAPDHPLAAPVRQKVADIDKALGAQP